jgi:signal transduction histidine kinase
VTRAEEDHAIGGLALSLRPGLVVALAATGLLSLQLAGVWQPGLRPLVGVAYLVFVVALAPTAVRRALGFGRVQWRWTLAATSLAAALAVVTWALELMTGVPSDPTTWAWGMALVVPTAVVAASFLDDERVAGWMLVRSVTLASVTLLIVAVYLVLVVGINGKPEGSGRDVLLWSLIAAVTAAVLVPLVHGRTMASIGSLLDQELPTTDDVVASFGTRMSRAVPMDELLLQLAESLRATVPGTRAEIWTGTGASMGRTVSVPSRPPASMSFTSTEETTVARTRIGGQTWAAVWVPALVPEEPTGDYRVVPVAHLGELLGLIVVYRPPESASFDDADEAALVELAHQLGLALHNVNLDSALQDSLEALARRNEELQASRVRIVAAADSTRRTIERNLHDGAQQHLVALAVKVGVIKSTIEKGGADKAGAMLDALREDVQATVRELRELAHGIYPPLLRDRGLGDALRAAATRSPLPCDVDDDLPGRYAEDVETAAYFCALEAMQNAGKHAGEGARITVTARAGDAELVMGVRDDGAGFDPEATDLSHGFVNMQDRLGALNGRLTVTSAPGEGTTVEAAIPARPLP